MQACEDLDDIVETSVRQITNADQELRVIKVACIEDDNTDFRLLKAMFENSNAAQIELEHYSQIDEFLLDDVETPDVVFLDRNLPTSAASETRIREIHVRHDYCPIILYTGCLTPSLRSTAAHEGAVAVIEKGMLSRHSITDLLKGAVAFAPHCMWKTQRQR
ncbi:response regulator [Hirschia maritima]|uniref:response regulator n=1 Tax=Hirschia maritima TaxID=1121961 RepID=UPI00036EF566|nr:response regulator [Hirschia maritima]